MATKKNENEITTVKDESKALAALGEDLIKDAIEDSGFQNVTANDMSIPFIRILQAMSPQVRGATKLPGASEGDFFNTVTEAVYKDNIKIICCAFQKAYVEWVPREQGGGFVAQHFDSAILEKTKRNDKNMDVLENGNIITPTAYHYCLLVKEDGGFERIVIAFTSTQLKKSRKWLSQMMSLQIKVGGKSITPPMFSQIYTVTSKEESNDFGSWYGYSIGSPELISDKELYAEAKKFHTDVSSGIVKTVDPVDTDLPTEGNNDLSSVEKHM